MTTATGVNTPAWPIDATVFVHAFKDHKILRGVVTGHERVDGYTEEFAQIRLDSGKEIICRVSGDNQSRLAETYRKQNRKTCLRA